MKILTAVLVTGLSVGAAAQAATFTDQASFFAATDVVYTETFSELRDATTSLVGPLTFGTGLTVSSETQNLFSVGTGQSTNTSVAIGSNFPREDSLMLDLGGIFSAFGLNIYQNDGGGSQTGVDQSFMLETFLGGFLVDTFLTDVASNGGSFFGFNEAGAFDSVRVFSTTGLFEVVDNVSAANNTSVIPLPASLPLLLAGFGALGLARKRRKAA